MKPVMDEWEPRPIGPRPCPAVTQGPFLGSDATELRCGLVAGHIGSHRHLVQWPNREATL